jgi:hypothetical protein
LAKDKIVKAHFTISTEHETVIKNLLKSILEKYSREGWKFDISFSFQSPDTDIICVTTDNKLFRDVNGKVVFRPGGHGALLKNLNEINADIISIKNIDNIAPDHLKTESIKYKRILIGYLISVQKKVFAFLKSLDSNSNDDELISEIAQFVKREIDLDLDSELKGKSLKENQNFLFKFLNKPIRICGMVKREDHPGGSPFWVAGKNGELTKQIVETAQVELSDPKQNKIFNDGTHFNPVDLVCSVKDFKGNNFDLEKFSNLETGLISEKSKDGKEIKVLEHPGLWNGGMYHWLTIFVEIPKITFNPVKEINDLLKPEHQPL